MVFSDLGQASTFMALEWVQQSLRRALGFSPYPATLNLRVESGADAAAWRELKDKTAGIEITPPDASFCRARCFFARIEGKIDGAVLVPEVEGYPEDKVELIAPMRIKDELKVQDGDKITVEFMD